jgi:hypothetical protein
MLLPETKNMEAYKNILSSTHITQAEIFLILLISKATGS